MMQVNLCSSALACCCDTQRGTWKSRHFLLPSEFGCSHFQGNQFICGLLHSCFILYVRKSGYLQYCKGMQIVQLINTSLYLLAQVVIVVFWAARNVRENGLSSGFCATCSHGSSNPSLHCGVLGWLNVVRGCVRDCPPETAAPGIPIQPPCPVPASPFIQTAQLPSLLALSSGLLLCHQQLLAPGCHMCLSTKGSVLWGPCWPNSCLCGLWVGTA